MPVSGTLRLHKSPARSLPDVYTHDNETPCVCLGFIQRLLHNRGKDLPEKCTLHASMTPVRDWSKFTLWRCERESAPLWHYRKPWSARPASPVDGQYIYPFLSGLLDVWIGATHHDVDIWLDAVPETS